MRQAITIEEPKFAQWLFASPQAAWIWLVARLYLGYEWLHGGFGKVTGVEGGTWSWHLAYTGDSWLKSSKALQGFLGYSLTNANKGPELLAELRVVRQFPSLARSPGTGGVFSKVIALREIAIGIALIIGLFVGIAAFFGATLNFSFGLAGIASVNPVFLVVEVLLVLAWRNAGYLGVDRYVLPAVGTPWHQGTMFHESPEVHSQLA